MKEFHRRKNSLLFLGDILVMCLALIVTLSIRYRSFPEHDTLIEHLMPFSALFAIWVLVFLIVGLYDESVAFDRKRLPNLVLRTQVINMFLAMCLFFTLPFGIEPKTNLLIYLGVSTAMIVSWRLFLYPKLQPERSLVVLLIGTGVELKSVETILSHSPHFKQVSIEHLDTSIYTDTSVLIKSLEEYINLGKLDMVVADMNDPVMQKLAPFFFNITFNMQAVRFFGLADFYERLVSRLPPSVIRESWMLEHMSIGSPHYAYDFLKRGIDLLGALILLLPCVVIFPIVGAIIYFQDKGAVFYRTIRIGQFNQPIEILKFRTMSGADSGKEALKSTLTITKFGMILRKLRIDELPQLINVLKGELSFIGPRPEMPALAEVYEHEIPYYTLRHMIKPGLSGWAQINNFDVPRSGVDIPRTIDKLSFDLYYLRHRSLALDIEIALKTINTVLSRTGS